MWLLAERHRWHCIRSPWQMDTDVFNGEAELDPGWPFDRDDTCHRHAFDSRASSTCKPHAVAVFFTAQNQSKEPIWESFNVFVFSIQIFYFVLLHLNHVLSSCSLCSWFVWLKAVVVDSAWASISVNKPETMFIPAKLTHVWHTNTVIWSQSLLENLA